MIIQDRYTLYRNICIHYTVCTDQNNFVVIIHMLTVARFCRCEFKLDPKSFIVGASENWSSPCLEVYRIILDMRFYRIPDNTGYRFALDTGYPIVPDTRAVPDHEFTGYRISTG